MIVRWSGAGMLRTDGFFLAVYTVDSYLEAGLLEPGPRCIPASV